MNHLLKFFFFPILLFLVACEPEPTEPIFPQDGVTALHEDFESLRKKNDITALNGWLNIMVVDTTYTAPLQWVAYETGCNIAVEATAHTSDDSNNGQRHETWLLSPPLDLDRTLNKIFAFRLQASYWQDSPSDLAIFLVRDVSGVTVDSLLKPLPASIPQTKTESSFWVSNSLDLSNETGIARVGFRYRAAGGYQKSTTFMLDDVTFGDYDSSQTNEIFRENFDTNFLSNTSSAGFAATSVAGTIKWAWNSNASGAPPYALAATISGYGSTAREEDWLISDSIDLSNTRTATLSFDHNIRAATNATPSIEQERTEQTLWISTTYTDAIPNGSDPAQGWHQVDIPTYPTGGSWSFVCSGQIDLAPYCGSSTVRIAFRYTSASSSTAATWSVREVKVKL
jgi:hypothetical protein